MELQSVLLFEKLFSNALRDGEEDWLRTIDCDRKAREVPSAAFIALLCLQEPENQA